jgi:hypothetical protein
MSSSKKNSSNRNIINIFHHDKVESVKLKTEIGEIFLDFPMKEIGSEKLPEVTILTITRNRTKFMDLAIDNFKRTYYPHDKLTWLIIDDSDTRDEILIDKLKTLKDKRIKYYYLCPERKDDKIIPYTVGYKRNFAIKNLINTAIISIMDDDDFFYDNSILARVCCMMFYKKEFVYSDELGIYNTVHENSFILVKFQDIPEGSLIFTKKFWEISKFEESNQSEGMQMVFGREKDAIKIPYFFNLIVLNHKNNTTNKGRNVRFPNTANLKNKRSTEGSLNFMKFFSESFKMIVKNI